MIGCHGHGSRVLLSLLEWRSMLPPASPLHWLSRATSVRMCVCVGTQACAMCVVCLSATWTLNTSQSKPFVGRLSHVNQNFCPQLISVVWDLEVNHKASLTSHIVMLLVWLDLCHSVNWWEKSFGCRRVTSCVIFSFLPHCVTDETEKSEILRIKMILLCHLVHKFLCTRNYFFAVFTFKLWIFEFCTMSETFQHRIWFLL